MVGALQRLPLTFGGEPPLGISVRAATTANITISTALNAGDTLDGVTLVAGDLVLVKDQSTTNQNGIYLVGPTPVRWRAFDTFNSHPGRLISVEQGTVNGNTLWLCTSARGGTLGSTALAFTLIRTPTFVVDISGHVTSFGGNIAFPATQVPSAGANVLDDYEEGTWTPTFTALTTPPTSVTYTTQTGSYTKIGNAVIYRFDVVLSSKGSGGVGAVLITGWPFTEAAGSTLVSLLPSGGFTNPSSGIGQNGNLFGTTMAVSTQVNTGAVTVTWADVTNSYNIRGMGVYRV